MAYYAIPYLIESALAAHLNSESFMGTVNGAYDALGTDMVVFPSVIVECASGSESPENSGNFALDVDIKVLGGMDSANDETFIDATAAHTDLCGNVHRWITSTATAALLSNTTDTDGNNVLIVHNVRLSGFARSLDTSEGVFEDTFTMEIYVQEAPTP